MKLFALLTLICCNGIVYSQPPTVLSTLPVHQTNNAPSNTEIAVYFDESLDVATVSGASFRVFGRWSGPAKGSLALFDNNRQVVFSPEEPFFAGEWVTVSLSKTIKSETGENLAKPYAWNFWIKTAPGQLDQPLVETIELRLPDDPTLLQTYGAYAGDLDNDGYSDLVAVNENSDDLRILLNDGQGGYPSFTIYDMGDDSTPSPSEGADFNNDGEIDLVVTTAWDTEVRVLTGNGQGSFTNLQTYFTSNGVRGVVVGDFDGDGWDDMLTTNRLSGNISIFMNDGTGGFTVSGMDLPGEDETACALTDVNNDGVMDVFFASYNSQKVGVLLGDGYGVFTPAASVGVQGKPWMIATGDFNGDGNADVATVNSNGNKTAVLFGDGQGGLGQPVHYSPINHNFPLAIDIGDLDGDGDLDLVTSNYGSKTYTVFENDGLGSFVAAATLNADSLSSCAILHDRDNDGDLDITGTDEGDDVILLFENPGQANVLSETDKNEKEIVLFPNPVSKTFTLSYALRSSQQICFSLHDFLGTPIKQWKKNQPIGNQLERCDVSSLPFSGIYTIWIKCDEFEIVKRFTIVR
ncbi:MAG: VCBS repeat-containing protein [Saprospiraceae bacterium]|nr:VCBS repeat-containing protein [Saprospiraceae bacterium]